YIWFDVKLLILVDEYQKTMRTSKYDIMFIMLTFITRKLDWFSIFSSKNEKE
ncbi:MAG: inner membrane CreD family protein, partial [Candidatus Cloacimonetes bacterium]|nr:inner membrane CreD family protein [Candidatus Cloacimonadota bacterium]